MLLGGGAGWILNDRAWSSRGKIYVALGQPDKAVADLSKVLVLTPKNGDTWLARAHVYRRLHQWDKAIADYTSAIELGPGYAGVWSERGQVYAETGRWKAAADDFAKEAYRRNGIREYRRGNCPGTGSVCEDGQAKLGLRASLARPSTVGVRPMNAT